MQALSTALQALTTSIANQQTDEADAAYQSLYDALGEAHRIASATKNTPVAHLTLQAWEHAQALKTALDNTQNLALGALTVAQTLQAQRDQLAQELAGIEAATAEFVETGVSTSPMINQVYDAVCDHIFANGVHLDCPGCAAGDHGWGRYDLNHDAVNALIDALFYTDVDADAPFPLPATLAQRISNFINDLLPEFEAHYRAFDPHTPDFADQEDESE